MRAIHLFTALGSGLLLWGTTGRADDETAAAVAAASPLLQREIDDIYPEIETLYHDLHRHPELGFQEVRTADALAKQMRALGFTVTENVGRTGLAAVYRNGRTELDALPMEEKTGLPYASTVAAAPWLGGTTAVMHACGHDLHMAVWVGTARTLLALKELWSGTLLFIGQPSEETVSGARAMIEDGVLTRFGQPDYGFALHSTPAAAGTLSLKLGTGSSAADNVEILFRGRGGHGAMPSATIDPIVIAARFVTDVQSIVSREKDAREFGVVTVGAFQAGSVANIIPDTAAVKLTLRSYAPAVRELLLAGVSRIANASAAMAGAPEPEIRTVSGTAAMVNDDGLGERTANVFEAAFGARFTLVPSHGEPAAASEDYSEFMAAGIASVFFSIGVTDPRLIESARNGGAPVPGNHSPFYAPLPQPAIKTGIEAMTLAVMNVLPSAR
jgi:hippurate hydrolase